MLTNWGLSYFILYQAVLRSSQTTVLNDKMEKNAFKNKTKAPKLPLLTIKKIITEWEQSWYNCNSKKKGPFWSNWHCKIFSNQF